MKKNISINISGIIFYIEEDTYDQLKTYLSSVEQYFASYEDSKEIIEDIETRMAEIFMSTLNNGKQVITQEDVNQLITTMGSVADFQAMEEDPAYQPITSNPVFTDGGFELQTEAEYKASLKSQPTANPPAKKVAFAEKEYAEDFSLNTAPNHQRHTEEQMPAYANSHVPRRTRGKRLYRDGNHKILGGVASGLAHYFNMDAMWVRLILIVLTFGLFFAPAVPAFTLISYITLWAVVPLNKELEENPQIRRFYRDRDRSTIGGVAAGLSHYLGIELTTLRILFVLGLILGGASLLLYTILWVISPEAKTITDRMKMEGEPITLQNIDSTLRKTASVPEKGHYKATTMGRIAMFPFKLAGIFINSISPLMRPFFVLASESIRIGGGFMAFLIGLVMTIGLTIGIIFTLGNFHVEGMYLGPVPARFYYNSMDLPALLATSMYFTLLIPSLFTIGLGISLLFRRWVIRSRFGWTMAGLWVVSLIGLGIALPPNINNFGYTNTSGKIEYYNFSGKTPVLLDLNPENGVKDYRRSSLALRGHAEKDFKLEYSFDAAGNSYQDAANNAQMISYGVQKEEGNVLLFDRNFTFKPGAKFRAQGNSMKLFIPYEKEFVMTNSLRKIIYNTINRNGYSAQDMDGKNVWKFKKSGRLVCVSCSHSADQEKIARYENKQRYNNYNEGKVSQEALSRAGGSGVKTFTVSDFKQLAIGGVFKVKIVKGNAAKVTAKGRDIDLDKIKVSQKGDKVSVRLKKGTYRNLKNIVLEISTPSLENLNVSGACKLTAKGFSEQQMYLGVSGASKIELKDGNADNFTLEVSGASKIVAYDFAVKNAQIELSGASKAYVQVQNKLSVDASGASKVRYKGNPTVSSSNSGVSSVRKAD
jgi:phage shock protein PspC (stress-responsive transcriptional regulator)